MQQHNSTLFSDLRILKFANLDLYIRTNVCVCVCVHTRKRTENLDANAYIYVYMRIRTRTGKFLSRVSIGGKESPDPRYPTTSPILNLLTHLFLGNPKGNISSLSTHLHTHS